VTCRLKKKEKIALALTMQKSLWKGREIAEKWIKTLWERRKEIQLNNKKSASRGKLIDRGTGRNVQAEEEGRTLPPNR